MVAQIRSFFIPFVTFFSLMAVSLLIIAYGRGYRLDINKNVIKPTGLISATSDPIGAQVYVNGVLKSATNNSFPISPDWYQVTISKEGYISWQKQLRVQGEVVSRADAYLFPTNPSLSPLTTLGVQKPTLSPDGTKIAYIVSPDQLDNGLAAKAGLWIYALSQGPLGVNRDPLQLARIDASFDMENAILTWSPDSTQVLAETAASSRLYQVARTGQYQDVSISKTKLRTDWAGEIRSKERQKLASFEQPLIDIATGSARIIALSPDETKILYEATATATIPQMITPPLIGTNPTQEARSIVPGNIYVYDSKEDKNFLLFDKKELPAPTPTKAAPKNAKRPPVAGEASGASIIHWFPTSRHILITLPGKIDIMEYDRTNWVTVYAGPFEDSFIAPWSNGSRIVILTNLNPGVSTLPNLYTVNLR